MNFHYDPGHAPLLKIWKKYDVFIDVIRNVFELGGTSTGWYINGVLKVSQVHLPKVGQKFWKNCHRWAAIVTKICASFKKIGPIGAKIKISKIKQKIGHILRSNWRIELKLGIWGFLIIVNNFRWSNLKFALGADLPFLPGYSL